MSFKTHQKTKRYVLSPILMVATLKTIMFFNKTYKINLDYVKLDIMGMNLIKNINKLIIT